MGRKGRPRKTRDQKLKDALARETPPDYIVARRALFAGCVKLPKGEGKGGEVDSAVCDDLGRLAALGLLDRGYGEHRSHDPWEMVRIGRFWGGHYAKLMKGSGVKTGSYERKDRSEPSVALTGEDMMFDRIDGSLPPFERVVLLSLIVDPLLGHEETVPWAQSLIDEELLKRKRLPPNRVTRFPDASDREKLAAAIRGLVSLVDGSLPHRRAA